MVQVEIGDNETAVDYFNMSIKKNKKYIPAYSNLADLYVKLEQYDEAERVLRNGLKYKKSKALKKRLKKLKKIEY